MPRASAARPSPRPGTRTAAPGLYRIRPSADARRLPPHRRRAPAQHALRRGAAAAQPAALGPAAGAGAGGAISSTGSSPWPATAMRAQRIGVAIHAYIADRPMRDRVFVDADGELLIVPQAGRLLIRTELGVLAAGPGEIAVVPRGIKFLVELPDGAARGYVCENYGPLAAPARARADRLQRPCQSARLPGAGRRLRGPRRGRSRWCRNSRGICGRRRSTIRPSMSSPGTAATCPTNTTSPIS